MRRHEHRSLRGWIALALAACFLLQSAAARSSGCLARVVQGRCCCAAPAETDGASACCAAAEHGPAPADGAAFESAGCRCELTLPAETSVVEVTTSARAPGAAHDAFAGWIESAGPSASFWAANPDVPRVERVPRPAASPPGRGIGCLRARLEARGVTTFLAELGTLLC